MRRLATLLLCVWITAGILCGGAALTKRRVRPATGPLAARMAKILADPAAKDAFWGIEIRNQESGKVLYALNANHFFVPASNTKLFTTALALTRLGPAYQFHTRVIRSGRDLVLVGAGDPNLSGRTIPYQPLSPEPAPLAAINQLADAIAARGIRRIEGDIIGDDTAFVYEPYAPGWGLNDTSGDDGPPVSAICVDDNVAELQVIPAVAGGSPVQTTWQLPFELFPVENAAMTDNPGRREIHYQRLPGSRVLRLWGSLEPGSPAEMLTLAVDDPARFAAQALKEALLRRGIVSDGQAIARHRWPGAPALPPLTGDLVTERVSPPLGEAAQVVDKVSQNLHAELLLRDVALKLSGTGTREGGLDELARFLKTAGVDADSYRFSDGSGLSRYNIVTPHAIATLLHYMADSPVKEQWMSLLPVGGVDGSLRTRFQAVRLNGEIHAKTGSLTHVSALSGYAVRKDGSTVEFSILVNNYGVSTAAIRELIDRLAAAIL
jgi:D-alanyl-D-alanine carboxypeptidase/D-alanyl-D-alanine-endopeptidase (penicillin-binding protein 4)